MHEWLDQLLDYRERFDPVECEDPSAPSLRPAASEGDDADLYMRGKDNAAHYSLYIFHEYLAGTVHWALLHRFGRDASDNASDRDSHEHEAHARQLIEGGLDSRQYRRLLIEYMIGSSLLEDAADALKRLDKGEVDELLEPQTWRRGRMSYSLWCHRLRACQHYHYLKAVMGSEIAAVERVSEAYGQDIATLRQWDLRIREILPDDYHLVKTAGKAGELACFLEKEPEYAESDGNTLDGVVYFWMKWLSDSLERDGRRFKDDRAAAAAIRQKGGRNVE